MPEQELESLSSILGEPALVVWGRAISDAETLRKQLNHLPSAESDYHGTLMVARSALRRLTINVDELIRMYIVQQDSHYPEVPEPVVPPVPRSRPRRAMPEPTKDPRISVRERIMSIIRRHPVPAGEIAEILAVNGIEHSPDNLQAILHRMRDSGMIKVLPSGMWTVA